MNNQIAASALTAHLSLRDRVEVLLKEIRERVLWEAARTLLKDAGFHTSLGWEQTTAAVLAEVASIDASRVARLEAALTDVLQVYNKDVRYYKISKKHCEAINALMKDSSFASSGELSGLDLVAHARNVATIDSPAPIAAEHAQSGGLALLNRPFGIGPRRKKSRQRQWPRIGGLKDAFTCLSAN